MFPPLGAPLMQPVQDSVRKIVSFFPLGTVFLSLFRRDLRTDPPVFTPRSGGIFPNLFFFLRSTRGRFLSTLLTCFSFCCDRLFPVAFFLFLFCPFFHARSPPPLNFERASHSPRLFRAMPAKSFHSCLDFFLPGAAFPRICLCFWPPAASPGLFLRHGTRWLAPPRRPAHPGLCRPSSANFIPRGLRELVIVRACRRPGKTGFPSPFSGAPPFF